MTYTFGAVSKETWEQLRNHSPLLPWNKVIWFKEAIPKFSFITWVAMKERLPTRDRLLSWGLSVSLLCVLCSSA
ncbi:putative reverse transcriptase zinc-binding domain-containing protein [Arabidopsis thaliana]